LQPCVDFVQGIYLPASTRSALCISTLATISFIELHLGSIKWQRILSALDHLKLEVKISHDLGEETEHVTVRSGEKKVPVKIWALVIVDCWGTVPTERCVGHSERSYGAQEGSEESLDSESYRR
jgi:hypothetical protein